MKYSVRSLLGVTVIASLVWTDAVAMNATDHQPNVLIIMCDQLNAGVLSCYGGPVPTPNIDRIANEGVRFEHAICPTPFCSPSRASIITGMYPHSHGIVTNIGRRDYPAIKSPASQEGIKRGDVTTERLLSSVGYATHHYGKWHLMDEDLPYYTDMYGEHHEYATEMVDVFAEVRNRDPATWLDWYGWSLPVEQSAKFSDSVRQLNGRWTGRGYAHFITKMGRLTLPLAQNFDVRVADKTIERISAIDGRPFMITCSFNAPHDPNVVPSPYYESVDPESIRLPVNRHVRETRFERQWSRQVVSDLGETGLREFLRVYFAMTKMIDDQVGRIIKVLENRKQLDNTIVVFTADHGDMAGGHGMVWKSTDAFYDEVARVPLLIRYPAQIRPQRSQLAVDLTDLMPTLLDLTRQPVPGHVQGQSLVPYLTGQREENAARQFAFCERIQAHPQQLRRVLPGTRGSFMVRGQGWKYVQYNNGTDYLYDLSDDPGETKNLAGDKAYRIQKKKMVNALRSWQQRTGWTETSVDVPAVSR